MVSKSLTFSFAAIFFYLFRAQAEQLKQKLISEYISYSSVPGHFLQDLSTTNITTFDFVSYLYPILHFSTLKIISTNSNWVCCR